MKNSVYRNKTYRLNPRVRENAKQPNQIRSKHFKNQKMDYNNRCRAPNLCQDSTNTLIPSLSKQRQIEVPNFEPISGRKITFTPKQWLERFRQYMKRKKLDTEQVRGAEMTQNCWDYKEIQEDFMCGFGPEELHQMTRRKYKTKPDRIAIKHLMRLLNEFFLPKRTLYHNREEFFWTKQTETETLEDFWWRLREIEKECTFE